MAGVGWHNAARSPIPPARPGARRPRPVAAPAGVRMGLRGGRRAPASVMCAGPNRAGSAAAVASRAAFAKPPDRAPLYFRTFRRCTSFVAHTLVSGTSQSWPAFRSLRNRSQAARSRFWLQGAR